MKKRFISLFLAAAMTAAALTACGQSSAPADSSDQTAQDTVADASEEASDAADASAEEGDDASADAADADNADADGAAEDASDAGLAATDTDPENPAVAFTLSIADAALIPVTVSTDQGEEERMPEYNEDHNMVSNIVTGAKAAFTVPEGTTGVYDAYLTIGKTPYSNGCNSFSLMLNDEKREVQPLPLAQAADEDATWESGLFRVATSISLQGGDTLSIVADPVEYCYAPIGDLILVPAGELVPMGYDDDTFWYDNEEADPSDPLSGLNIVWLGSSVTYGSNSGGYSMADAIADNHAGTRSWKYTVSGTTLVDDEGARASYVSRIHDVDDDLDDKVDLVIIQLSTNDATNEKPLGVLSEGTDPANFDVATITGAEEYLIAYAKVKWDCPVAFYTGTYYESEAYAQMVEGVKAVCDKWDAGLINLWDDQEMTDLYGTDQYNAWMANGIHPNRDGYVEWWTPKFEAYLSEWLSK